MTIRIGINGFGRIGRNVFRAIGRDPLFRGMAVVAINDLNPRRDLVHLLKYDSVMGPLSGVITASETGMTVDGAAVAITAEREPGAIPWGRCGVTYVIEATGCFTHRDQAKAHLNQGVQRVVITAPARGDVKTFVVGVNEDAYDPRRHQVVSNASCTTNCLATMARVMLDRFGIRRGLITTIHPYTNDQRLLDFPHPDLRRARAAGMSMIPTQTGAAVVIGRVIPALKNRFEGLSIRIPTPNVSLLDAVMEVELPCGVDEVNQAFKTAASRFLGYSEAPLVSIDFQGDPRSAIVDAECTRVIGQSVKVMSWYDNEWGYANRTLDLIRHMAQAEI